MQGGSVAFLRKDAHPRQQLEGSRCPPPAPPRAAQPQGEGRLTHSLAGAETQLLRTATWQLLPNFQTHILSDAVALLLRICP